jgi:hypothetical protein
MHSRSRLQKVYPSGEVNAEPERQAKGEEQPGNWRSQPQTWSENGHEEAVSAQTSETGQPVGEPPSEHAIKSIWQKTNVTFVIGLLIE